MILDLNDLGLILASAWMSQEERDLDGQELTRSALELEIVAGILCQSPRKS